jgi:hypothetical protein
MGMDGLRCGTLHPPCGNIVMHLGFTMQFEETECSGPSVVVVASSSTGGSWRNASWGGTNAGENYARPLSWRRWRRLHAVTLLNALPLQLRLLTCAALGENLDMGI